MLLFCFFLAFPLLQIPRLPPAAAASGYDLETSPASLNPDPDPGQLEIFSWWTAPGEEEGLAWLMQFFQQELLAEKTEAGIFAGLIFYLETCYFAVKEGIRKNY
ncbi:hypothetical protein [Halarsenatibacter silvermanii]|nr:hypothetical protein [Halarsenatibacter silvermanii]